MVVNLLRKAAPPLVRRFGTTSVNRSHHDTTGIAGSTLPFGINNRYALTVGFILYFGSGLGLPYIALRRSLLKNK